MSSIGNGRTLRKGRASLPGQVYFLTTVTHERVRWFKDFELGCLASKTLARLELWPDARLMAWVLMPDHLHLLVELGGKDSLSLVMQRLKSVLSTALRIRLGPVNIWQAGFHDHALRKDEALREVARYLIANPIRAGLVERVEDYPFWDSIWLEPNSNPLDL